MRKYCVLLGLLGTLITIPGTVKAIERAPKAPLLSKQAKPLKTVRGPRGKRGQQGASGPQGAAGASAAAISMPGTLSVSFTPLQDTNSTGTWNAYLVSQDGTIVASSSVFDVTQSYPQQTITASYLTAGIYTFVIHNIDALDADNPPGQQLIESSGNPGPLIFTYSEGQENLNYDDAKINYIRPYPGNTQDYFYTLYQQ
jgi:hypothetical protein